MQLLAGQINKGKKEQEGSQVKSSYKRCSVKVKKNGEKEERGEEESQEGMDSHRKENVKKHASEIFCMQAIVAKP